MTPGKAHRHRARRPLRTVALVLLVSALLVALVASCGVWYLEHRLSSQITRLEGVFDDLPDRPPPTRAASSDEAPAVNILLLGTDRRSRTATTGADAAGPTWLPGAQRSDTIMLLHIDGDRRGATVVSLPRDAWVDVPGHGMAKINAAYSWAGPSLAVQTVEALTDVRIDHLAVVDWAGFRALTDELGGVTVQVPQTVTDPARGLTWTAGEHVLDGEQALAYVRQRKGLPGGDLDRVRRQQNVLRLLMEGSLHTQMRSDPGMLYDFLDTLTAHLSVDDEWSTREMAALGISLRGLRTADIRYLTAPVTGVGWAGAQSVVYLDGVRGAGLWEAIRHDRVDQFLAEHPRMLRNEPIS